MSSPKSYCKKLLLLWLQINEDLGWKVTGSKLGASKDSSLWNLLKCTLPLVICIHNINSCGRCIDWLHICFTCVRCDMSSINKRSTRVVATLKKISNNRRGQYMDWRLLRNSRFCWHGFAYLSCYEESGWCRIQAPRLQMEVLVRASPCRSTKTIHINLGTLHWSIHFFKENQKWKVKG